MDEIIIEPVLTEKSNVMREAHKYAFKVSSRANKLQIMATVGRLFGVHPLSCRIMTVKRKPKRVRYRLGYTAAWKKAIITLPEGETISVFEGA
jgi:large subunit ribosomal protein L23